MKTTTRVAVMTKGSGTTADEMAVIRDEREETAGMSFDAAVERFVKLVQAKIDAYYTGYNARMNEGRAVVVLQGHHLTIESGKRYVRVWTTSTMSVDATGPQMGSRFIFAFLDRATGDVLMPASHKAPAKHARGNVFAADGGEGAVGETGRIVYLRR